MENILEDKKSQSIRVVIENLEGGFISNAGGTRKIYKDVDGILDALDIDGTLKKLPFAEYKFNVDIIHQDEYQDHEDLLELKASIGTAKEMSLEDAKENGTIEVEKYNPLKNAPVEPDLHGPIKITAANMYSVARLKAIDWKKFEQEMPMLISEKAKISGINDTSLYVSWKKVLDGTMQFQRTPTRIGFTILAQYYENTLGLRSSTADKCEQMKKNMLKLIRDMELIYSGKQFVKVGDISPKLMDMRKELL